MRKHVFTSLALCAALVAATPVMADRDHRHRKHHGHYDAPRKVAYYENTLRAGTPRGALSRGAGALLRTAPDIRGGGASS